MECGNAMTHYCEDLLNAGPRKCVSRKDSYNHTKHHTKGCYKHTKSHTKKTSTATRNDFISSDNRITEGGTISNIGRLQELGLLRREGGKKEGKWVVDIM